MPVFYSGAAWQQWCGRSNRRCFATKAQSSPGGGGGRSGGVEWLRDKGTEQRVMSMTA
jgi:hypothetical protein